MRNSAFLILGFLLLVVQSQLHRLVDAIHPSAATPGMLLPLIVFMGVHEYSMARGAALSFVLGYLADVFSGGPLGLFTFITSATFLVARVAGVRLAAQTLLTKLGLALGFALLESVLVVVFTAIVGNDPHRARSSALLIPGHAVSTALLAPIVFHLAERVHAVTTSGVAPPEGGER